MFRSLAPFALFTVATCYADTLGVAQFRISIPAHNTTGSQPPPWPDGVETSIMKRIEREAPKIAVSVYPPEMVKGMRFVCVRSLDRRTEFEVLVEGPEKSRDAIQKGLNAFNLALVLRDVELVFTYKTTGADVGSDKVAHLSIGKGQTGPNQSTDPTLASGTPPAGQESRHP